MLSILKKKKKVSPLYAVCDGVFKNIIDVNDAVFAEKIMGDGYAITPNNTNVAVYSPIKGKVLSIFPTKHAITFETHEGVEVLLHMGLDTVALKGEGFTIHVNEGDPVNDLTLLANMDVDFMKEQNRETDIIVVITNLEKNKVLDINQTDAVNAQDEIGKIVIG